MANTDSFELYTFKEGQWQLDSVFDIKQDASHEAWRLYNSGHFDGVKVIQETYKEEENKATAVIVMQRLKGEEGKPPVRRTVAKKEDLTYRRKTVIRPQKKPATVHHVGMMGILICVILLGLVGVGFFVVD
ncbi:MAG: hypothetical protein WD407_03270 [Rhodospirillales bacterium]